MFWEVERYTNYVRIKNTISVERLLKTDETTIACRWNYPCLYMKLLLCVGETTIVASTTGRRQKRGRGSKGRWTGRARYISVQVDIQAKRNVLIYNYGWGGGGNSNQSFIEVSPWASTCL